MNILLSIHPEYVDAILSGRKLYEFRRRRFKTPPRAVVIYATAPVSRVVGWFSVEETIVSSADSIWEVCGADGGIARAAFDKYYAGAEQAVALKVGSVFALPHPVTLESLSSDLKPPQSYQILSDECFSRMREISGAHALQSLA